MGLLDDAIREHLELKRRSGADASELSRLERDAFGAGTAGPAEDAAHEADEPGEAAAVATSDDPFDFDAAPVAPEHAHEPLPEPEQPTRQFTLEEMQEAERREAPPALEPESAREPAREPEPVPAPRASEPPPAPESEPAPEGAPGEHDELEETPEFLQETPEHDKLWFEQKPPKDFDF